MIETARKEDLFLDKKLIIPENRLDAIRIMARLHPVVGDQPTNEKDQPNTNNPVLDLACTILNIHEKGIGVHADLRPIQNEPPSYFYGKGFMSGISNLKGNGILAVYAHWRDGSGRYAINQFYYTDKEILWRNAVSDTAWSAWFDVLTGNSDLDYNKLLNVPITHTLSDDKSLIASIYAVNQVNRAAVTAQKAANTADGKAVAAMNEAKKKRPENDNKFNKTGGLIEIGGNQATNGSLRLYDREGDDFGLFMFKVDEGIVSAWLAHKTNGAGFRNVYLYHQQNTTTDPAGFLRAFGNSVALTTDKLTSDLKVNRSDLVASAKYAYDVYQAALAADKKAVNAQTTANTGITNAKTAQERADAAFSRIKPITEGGTGATTVANARKNLGIDDIPVDQVFIFESATPPPGYIARNGQIINESTMPKLYAKYGSSMPDDRNRVHRMQGNLTGSVGSTQEDAIRNITASFYYQKTMGNVSANGAFNYIEGPNTGNSGYVAGHAPNANTINFDASRVVPTASENRVKSRIVIFCNKIQ